jgi:hypothetical protein
MQYIFSSDNQALLKYSVKTPTWHCLILHRAASKRLILTARPRGFA